MSDRLSPEPQEVRECIQSVDGYNVEEIAEICEQYIKENPDYEVVEFTFGAENTPYESDMPYVNMYVVRLETAEEVRVRVERETARQNQIIASKKEQFEKLKKELGL